jgi:hypothetical protein
VILVSEGGQPWDIGLQQNDVYWLNTNGNVQRISKQGTGKKVMTSGLINPFRLAVDGGGLFWSHYQHPFAAEGMPLGGGPTTVYGNLGLGSGLLGLDDTNVYWSSSTDPAMPAKLMKTPRAGGPQTAVVPGPKRAGDVASDGGYLYWVEATSLADVPVSPPGGLRRTLAGGGPVEVLATSHDMYALAFDQDYVYWTYAGNYTTTWVGGAEIRRVPRAGGAVETVVALAHFANSIAVDADNVYWASYDGNEVNKASKQGGPIIQLSAGGTPKALAIDDEAVYWVDPVGGVVAKVAK